jgi:predicted HTH domain antitoxin
MANRRAARNLAERFRELIEALEEPEPLDWLLALLHASRGRLPSKVHVQKALFIASMRLQRLSEAVEFRAYRMGPWSEEINDALEAAYANGWVREESSGEVVLTLEGSRKASEAWRRLEDGERRTLAEVANFIKRMSVDELLLYVYTVYGYGEKSDVIDKLLRRRRRLALSLLRKGLVSTELAARIAGMPLQRFIAYLRRLGVKPYEAEAGDIDEASRL